MYIFQRHRVLVPEDKIRDVVRHSLAFFAIPDDDCEINTRAIGGTEQTFQYRTVTPKQYIAMKIAEASY